MRGALAPLLALCALSIGACKTDGEASSAPSARPPAATSVRAPAREPAPLEALVARFARDGRTASEKMAAATSEAEKQAAYLAVRRSAHALLPLVRIGAPIAGEALFGAEREAEEGQGAIVRLDAALQRIDAAAVQKELEQAHIAFRLAEGEIQLPQSFAEVGMRSLSFAAYDLGLQALGAMLDTLASDEALVADLQGSLDFIAQGLTATLVLCSPPRELEAAVDAAQGAIAELRSRLASPSQQPLADRAAFVLATGTLGVKLRRALMLCGGTPRLPYAAKVPVSDNGPDEPISALTVPAPRGPAPSDPRRYDDPAWVALGARLFQDKALSSAGTRACTSCHDPAKGYADGLRRPRSLDPQGPPLRHTPSLLYTSLNAAQMWDGRTLTAESQALGVIHARAEMGLAEGELSARINADEAYKKAFSALPGGASLANVGYALAAFESARLSPASAPIDAFARGDSSALTRDARSGFDVFAGKGRCTRCHVPPSFAGSRPRDFAVPVFSVLGVPTEPAGKTLDLDRGRGAVTGRARDDGAFKTPTVRDVSRTAPYFHNGAFPRLEDVVDFYDRGGGTGLGLDVKHQDPDVVPLRLSAEERRVLLVFMREALTDRAIPRP